MSALRRWSGPFLVSLVVFSLTTQIRADETYPKTPKDVMEKYLALDADAAGLSDSTFPELGRYTTWPSAPAWDNFVVIDHYEVGRVLVGTTRAQAIVTYQPLGTMTTAFTPNVQPEAVTYHLNNVNGSWKVDSPQLVPHVAWGVMKRRLEAAGAKDPKVKKVNDDLIARIIAVKQMVK
jgi:hypothetical protein